MSNFRVRTIVNRAIPIRAEESRALILMQMISKPTASDLEDLYFRELVSRFTCKQITGR